MYLSRSAKLAVSVCHVLYLALTTDMIYPHHHYMISFQFSFRAMEQIRTDTLLNPHPIGGCFIVVNKTETQKTRSALALQDILKISTRDLGSMEAASRRSNFSHLITDESVNWKAPPFLSYSSYDSIPSTFLHHQDFGQLASLSTLPSNSTFLLYRPCEEAILGCGKSVNL